MSERLPRNPEENRPPEQNTRSGFSDTLREYSLRYKEFLRTHDKLRLLKNLTPEALILVAAANGFLGEGQSPNQNSPEVPPPKPSSAQVVPAARDQEIVPPMPEEPDGLPNPFAHRVTPLTSAFIGTEPEKVAPIHTQTSTLLMGRGGANLIFLDCVGSSCTEPDWNSDSIARVTSDVEGMLSRVQVKVLSDHPLTRLSLTRLPISAANIIQTNGEAINTPSLGHPDLINSGVPEVAAGNSGFEKILNLNRNSLQGRNAATTIVVVSGVNDADKRFPDRSNYAYIGGPYAMYIYEGPGANRILQQQRLWHEFLHLFYGQDQYAAANVPCDKISGYFGIQNQNSELGCAINVLSIMRSVIQTEIDPYAYQQTGIVYNGINLAVAGNTTVTDLGKTGNTYRYQIQRVPATPAPGFAESSINGIQMAMIRQSGKNYQARFVDGQPGGMTEVVEVDVPNDTGKGSLIVDAMVGLDHVHFIGPEGEIIQGNEVYMPLVGR